MNLLVLLLFLPVVYHIFFSIIGGSLWFWRSFPRGFTGNLTNITCFGVTKTFITKILFWHIDQSNLPLKKPTSMPRLRKYTVISWKRKIKTTKWILVRCFSRESDSKTYEICRRGYIFSKQKLTHNVCNELLIWKIVKYENKA